MIGLWRCRSTRTLNRACAMYGSFRSRSGKELEKFFVATAELQAKTLECLGWRGPKHAIRLIKKAGHSSS